MQIHKDKKEKPERKYEAAQAKKTDQYPLLDDLLKSDEETSTDEMDRIECMIAERERIKQKNIRFLEEQRQKLEELINRTECLNYGASGANEVRNRLTAQIVLIEMRKGEEYVNAFRDIQRLEEQKRQGIRDKKESEGWLG